MERRKIKTEEILQIIQDYYTPLLSSLRLLKEKGVEDKVFDKVYISKLEKEISDIREIWVSCLSEWESPDTQEERRKEIQSSADEWISNLILWHNYNKDRLPGEDYEIPPYRIEIDPETGEKKQLTDNYWKNFYLVPKLENNIQEADKRLELLNKLSQIPSLSHISISKDLVSSEFQTQGDVLDLGTEEEKNLILKYQKKGKLLFNSLEGLSGGTAFFKSVSIALAKILNEQSNYFYKPEKGDRRGGYLLSGIPKDRVKEVFGETVEVKGDVVPIRDEERNFPYIILSYERLAREVSKTGKITGGKDIEFARLYINGGYKEFKTDPKTGEKTPVKSSYVPGLSSKKYPVSDGRGHFIFLPFVVNEAEIVDTSRKDPEVGCLLRLSPQYSKTLRGYTSLRGDTIQLIGGGKQKEITMDILSFLVFSRNTSPVLKKRKTEILSKYIDRPTYRGRPGKLETHFQEAIQKAVSAKILLPGEDRDGNPRGYREEVNSGGETISVFTYNPDYLKGEKGKSQETPSLFPEEESY